MPLQTLVRARAFLKRTPEDHRRAAATAPGGEMPRVLSRSDLTLLSLGSVVGAGVFVLTGVAAADHGGPSVVLAYLLAGGTALLSALCYTEFAASMPVTGGSVVYVGCQFGELAAVIGTTRKHTHTHTERERERERKRKTGGVDD